MLTGGYLNSCNAYNARWVVVPAPLFFYTDVDAVKAIVLPVCWLCISNTGCICEIYIAGWWFQPSEIYESVGIMNFQLNGKSSKSMVPNHQPDIIEHIYHIYHIYIWYIYIYIHHIYIYIYHIYIYTIYIYIYTIYIYIYHIYIYHPLTIL